MLSSLRTLGAWIAAHPGQFAVYLGIVVNVVNGLLPVRYRGVLARVLDRVSVLTRRDATGTLKWPLVASAVLRGVADSLDPPRPTTVPPPPAGGL